VANLYLAVDHPIVRLEKRRFVRGVSQVYQVQKGCHGFEYFEGPWSPVLEDRVPEGAFEMGLSIQYPADEQDVVFVRREGAVDLPLEAYLQPFLVARISSGSSNWISQG